LKQNTHDDIMTKDPVSHIILTRYCNFVNIQASTNDVALDFMELPGIPRDGKQVVEGVRVYMTHDHARFMADAILSALQEKSNENSNEKPRGITQKPLSKNEGL